MPTLCTWTPEYIVLYSNIRGFKMSLFVFKFSESNSVFSTPKRTTDLKLSRNGTFVSNLSSQPWLIITWINNWPSDVWHRGCGLYRRQYPYTWRHKVYTEAGSGRHDWGAQGRPPLPPPPSFCAFDPPDARGMSVTRCHFFIILEFRKYRIGIRWMQSESPSKRDLFGQISVMTRLERLF